MLQHNRRTPELLKTELLKLTNRSPELLSPLEIIKEIMEEQNPWTSIDLYYKGVHVKKSIPQSIKVEDLKNTIDIYLDAGFKPSWNEDTNKTASQSVSNAPNSGVKDIMEGQSCDKCDAPMKLSKKGNWYCSAKCWL